MLNSASLRLNGARQIAPGLAVAILLALLAQALATRLAHGSTALPPMPLSPIMVAVLVGLLWRNTLGVTDRVLPGLQWITHSLLRVGIALVGLRLALHGIGALVLTALPVVLGCITVAITVALLVGRRLSPPLRILLAAGTAICGCTAVVALSPVVRARPLETGLALTCVVVLGATGMLLYPWLAQALFHSNVQAAGIFLGTAIHDTSQVVGASLIYAQQFAAPDVVPIAGFTKLLRNLSMLVLIPLAAAWIRHQGEQLAEEESGAPRALPQGTGLQRSQVLPTFLIWFLALALARNLGDHLLAAEPAHSSLAWSHAWAQSLSLAATLSDLFLVCGMTAVGLSVALPDLRQIGTRALAMAVIVALSVAVTSLTLTYALMRLTGGL